jgi:gamma-glutamylcyclotransferase (GGCT)/AIG2-like uncharacterized protein YtfP
MERSIFVYGTLRRGGSANTLLRGERLLRRASLPGELHDVEGRYPALLLEGDDRVEGELWSSSPALLTRLDEYEGVGAGLFRRALTRLDGEEIWVYVAGPRLAPRLGAATRLPGGVWEG